MKECLELFTFGRKRLVRNRVQDSLNIIPVFEEWFLALNTFFHKLTIGRVPPERSQECSQAHLTYTWTASTWNRDAAEAHIQWFLPNKNSACHDWRYSRAMFRLRRLPSKIWSTFCRSPRLQPSIPDKTWNISLFSAYRGCKPVIHSQWSMIRTKTHTPMYIWSADTPCPRAWIVQRPDQLAILQRWDTFPVKFQCMLSTFTKVMAVESYLAILQMNMLNMLAAPLLFLCPPPALNLSLSSTEPF